MSSGQQFPPFNPNAVGPGGQAPGGPGPSSQPAKSSNTMTIVFIILGVLFGGMLVCGGILAALLIPAIGAAREAAQRMQKSNQLKQVGLALHNYHSAYKRLPARTTAKTSGEEVFGWRLSISPFAEGQNQWETYDYEQSWDSSANASVSAAPPEAFQALDGPPGETDIFAIETDLGMFTTTPNENMRFRDTLDGLANTAMAIQIPGRTVPWTSTQDITPDEAYNAITALEGADVAHLLMGDGAVIAVSSDLPRETWDALVTRDGGEQVMDFGY